MFILKFIYHVLIWLGPKPFYIKNSRRKKWISISSSAHQGSKKHLISDFCLFAKGYDRLPSLSLDVFPMHLNQRPAQTLGWYIFLGGTRGVLGHRKRGTGSLCRGSRPKRGGRKRGGTDDKANGNWDDEIKQGGVSFFFFFFGNSRRRFLFDELEDDRSLFYFF